MLAACAGAILIIHAFRLWMHQSQRYQEGIRKIAVLILAATLLAIFQAGYKILKDPRLLKGGEQMQKSNE